MKKLAVLFILLGSLFPFSVSAQKNETNDIDVNARLSGTVSNKNQFSVDYRIVVTAPYKTNELKVWLPIPQTDRAQKITNLRLSTFPQKVDAQINREKKFGNKFAYFHFKKPLGAQVIRFQFDAEVGQVNWGVDLAKVRSVEKWPAEFSHYLRNEFDSETQGQLDTVLANAIPNKNNNGLDVKAILNWTDKNLSYSHENASLKADAKHAIQEREGHCSDFHGLCSALGRTLGYPARVTYGLAMLDKGSPSHCKLEVYLPPHGWVIFDVSETQKLVKIIERSDLTDDEKKRRASLARATLLSGFRDNTWLQVTKGTNYELVPATTKKTVPLIRTIYAEADGKALPEPDPSNVAKKEFSWMTAYQVKARKKQNYPFKNIDFFK